MALSLETSQTNLRQHKSDSAKASIGQTNEQSIDEKKFTTKLSLSPKKGDAVTGSPDSAQISLQETVYLHLTASGLA